MKKINVIFELEIVLFALLQLLGYITLINSSNKETFIIAVGIPYLISLILYLLLYLFNRPITKHLIVLHNYLIYLIFGLYSATIILIAFITNLDKNMALYSDIIYFLIIIIGIAFSFFTINTIIYVSHIKLVRLLSSTAKLYDDILESNLPANRKNELIKKLNSYYKKGDLTAIKNLGQADNGLNDKVLNSYFKRNLFKYLLSKLVRWFLLFITFGLAYPFTLCLEMRQEVNSTCYDNHKLSFAGKGKSLFVKWVSWYFFTIITVGIFALFIPKKITVFKISHTHLLDIKLQGLSCFTGNMLKELLINLAFIASNVLTLFLLYPVALCLKNKWYYKHTFYDGYQIMFLGRARDLYHKYLRWLFLAIITLGIYSIYSQNRIRKWEVAQTHLAFIAKPYLLQQTNNKKLLQIKDGLSC